MSYGLTEPLCWRRNGGESHFKLHADFKGDEMGLTFLVTLSWLGLVLAAG